MDRQLFSTLLTTLLLTFTFNAHANNIKVHVHDASNARPLKGMAVCLGTPGNTNQFGATRTDARGNVEFSNTLPNTPVILTVSGSQHKGLQRVLPAGLAKSNTDLVRTIDLPRGGLGPVCNAPPAMIVIKPVSSKHNGLKVAGLVVDRGHTTTNSRSVVLNPSISGQPTHYRISEDPEFKDADWLMYQKTPLFTLSNGEGRKRVYFQVRKASESGDSSVQTTSNVVSDWITLLSD